MGLFKNTKDLCPICDNPTPRLLPQKIEDKPICKECEKKISMSPDVLENITLSDFKEHLKCRENNQNLHESFCMSKRINFQYTKKLCIDDEKKLFYIDNGTKNPRFLNLRN